LNRLLHILTATTCSALIYAGAVLAKMTPAEEQQYGETKQAAIALVKSKDLVKAGEKFTECKALAVKGGDKNKEFGTLMRMSSLSFDQGDFPGAEASLKEALAIVDDNADLGEGRLANCLYQLSIVLEKEKRDNDAKPYFARCIDVSRRIYSANHPALAVRTSEYASLISRLGDREEGAKLAFQSQSQVNAFMDDMSKKIKKAWDPTPESVSYQVSVSYRILNQGKVDKVEVTKSSGSAIADKAAVDAVKDAAPFSDINCSDPDDELCLAFTFDYNVNHRPKHNASGSSKGSTKGPDIDSGKLPHTVGRRQSREVLEETKIRLTEERTKSEKLKEEIDKLLKTAPADVSGAASGETSGEGSADATKLANLYAEYSESLGVQGEHEKAASLLRDALSKTFFKKTDDPPAIALRIALAHIYLSAPGLGDAETTFRKLIESAKFAQVPVNLKQEALSDYGNCLSKKHRFAEAQEYYTRARELKE
jgi:TonB family protein